MLNHVYRIHGLSGMIHGLLSAIETLISQCVAMVPTLTTYGYKHQLVAMGKFGFS